MRAIPIYAPNETDTSTNGLGLLTPIECRITEKARGMCELTLVQPISDDLRWTLLGRGCLVKAPMPIRESPEYVMDAFEGTEETITTTSRAIYRVSTQGGRLHLRSKPGTSARIIAAYKPGTQVVKLSDAGSANGYSWARVSVVNGGATGYMATQYLSYVKTVSETVTTTKPITREGVVVQPSRDQLFRIYSVSPDTERGIVTAKAKHIFYDLVYNVINGKYAPENADAVSVAETAFSMLCNEHPFTLYARAGGAVTGDYSMRNIVEVLLDPDDGIATQVHANVIRDNYDIFLIPDEVRDMGVTVRRRKNLKGVTVEMDESDVITRVIPVGSDKDGNPLYLEGTRWVDSPYIGEYPAPRARSIQYSVSSGTEEFETDDDARAELARRAALEFSQNGIDLPSYGMEVKFFRVRESEEYPNYAVLQSVHLYDTITVIDELINLHAKLRVTGYVWNVLTEQYDDVTLGELQSMSQTIYSYNIPNGTVSGNKLIAGSVDGAMLRDLSVKYGKIDIAAIKQLNAESITAITAHINEIVAGDITTDQLYAALAKITTAQIKDATIDWAQIGNVDIGTADIKNADIDWAHIKDLVSDTAIITQGVGGELYIARLAVTEANMVSLTVGELIVKGSDGGFYSLGVDADGNVTTTLKQVSNDDVADLSINGGEKIIEGSITAAKLNAQDIFADSAIIRQLIAANIDVDTLFAREVFTSGIIALADQLDLSANTSVNIMIKNNVDEATSGLNADIESANNMAMSAVQNAQNAMDAASGVEAAKDAATAAQEAANAAQNAAESAQNTANATETKISTWFSFSDDGLETRKASSTYSTLVDDTGFHVLQLGGKIGSFAKRQLSTVAVRIGEVGSAGKRMVMREAADGGIAFVLEGAS